MITHISPREGLTFAAQRPVSSVELKVWRIKGSKASGLPPFVELGFTVKAIQVHDLGPGGCKVL